MPVVPAPGTGEDIMTLNVAARRPARVLGLAGLIPFVALTVALYAEGPRDRIALAQLAYGATIVSFIGALHWGLAMRERKLDETAQWRALGWGVVPSLVAWCALLLPLPAGLWLLAALVPVCGWMDARLSRELSLESWFMRLRTLLSGAVTLCLVLSARVAG